MSDTSIRDTSYTKSSFEGGVWSTEVVAHVVRESVSPAISSIMSQAIPPSVTVPVPDGTRTLPQKELDSLPYEWMQKLAHLCRVTNWSKERIISDKRLLPELEGELKSGFPKLLESTDPHNPAAHLWLFRDTHTCVLVLRGVGSVGESMMNLPASLSTVQTGQVHTGFLTQFRTLEPFIREELQSFRGDFSSLVITGQGIGGALATVCVPHFATICPETKFSCITFGSPRVGDSLFKEWFNSYPLEYKYRFILEDDPLPMFPSNNRFVHCMDAVCLRHDGRFELWPETLPPRWEIPFGSLVMYVVSVFVHMQWEYDEQYSHACSLAMASPKHRGA